MKGPMEAIRRWWHKPCRLCASPTYVSGYSGIRYCKNDGCAWQSTDDTEAVWAQRQMSRDARRLALTPTRETPTPESKP